MFCKSCGSEIKDGQSFCANCGAPVTPPAQPAVQAAVQQVPQPVVQQVQPAVQPAQPVQQAPAAAPASVPAKPAKKSKGFAIAGFILGLNTVEFCFIIFINLFSLLFGLAGTILSILALTKKNGKLKPLAVIGLILSVFGLFVAGLSWASLWSDDASRLFTFLFGWVYDAYEVVNKIVY